MSRKTVLSFKIFVMLFCGVLAGLKVAAQQPKGENIGLVRAVAFSPDGKRIAFGSTDGAARILDAETGKQLSVFPDHKSSVNFVRFLPESKQLLSASGDGTVYVWDLTSGALVRQFSLGHIVYHLELLPDNVTLMSGRGESVYDFYDITAGTLMRSIKQQNPSQDRFEYASVFDIAPDGKSFLSRGAYKTEDKTRLLRLRNIETGKDIRLLRLPKDEEAKIIKISPDGRTALIGGYKISLWNIAAGKLIKNISLKEAEIKDLAFSSDGKQAVSVGGASDSSTDKSSGVVKLWDIKTAKVIRQFIGHNRAVNAVAFSPDGKKIVTGGDDAGQSPLRVWAVESGREIFSFPANSQTNEKNVARIN